MRITFKKTYVGYFDMIVTNVIGTIRTISTLKCAFPQICQVKNNHYVYGKVPYVKLQDD